MSSFDQAFFDELYRGDIDPWGFRTSVYERDKYAATMQALPPGRYGHCLELGCSIGALTRSLATRCDRITAIDTSEVALDEARRTCADLDVTFLQAHLPEDDFGTGFDLVIASEVLYYLDPHALSRLAERLSRAAVPGAVCIGVHWTGPTDYPLSGDRASALFAAHAALTPHLHRSFSQYRLDVWTFPASETPSG